MKHLRPVYNGFKCVKECPILTYTYISRILSLAIFNRASGLRGSGSMCRVERPRPKPPFHRYYATM